MDMCLSQRQIPEQNLACCLSELALKLRSCLAQHGAIFAADFQRIWGVPATEVSRALWELVAAGLVTADGFDSLRMLIDPRRRQRAPLRPGSARNTTGRWSLLCLANTYATTESVGQGAERHEAELASACSMLLRRYGVVFRDVLGRESTIPKWRELLPMMRRMEARGTVRGGRFLSGFGGEQFALPEALVSLRNARQASRPLAMPVEVAAADPLNLIGMVIPGERVAAIAGKFVVYDHASLTATTKSALIGTIAQSAMFAAGPEQAPEARL